MQIILCGTFNREKKKPCKHCKNFMLWGTSVGRCFKHNKDTFWDEHCKYYKRDSEMWTVRGKCKIDENDLYA